MSTRFHRTFKIAFRILKVLFTAGGFIAGIALLILWQSLPKVRGTSQLTGLKSPVRVERDRLGIPTLSAENRADLSQALGYLHAQERYFQMDLLRRLPAGELSELVGERALEFDRRARLQGLRATARQVVAGLGDQQRQWLLAYTQGVNQGLGDLRCSPIEYWALRARPDPWRPEDTLLVCYNLYRALQDVEGEKTRHRGTLFSHLPRDVARYLAHNGSNWEAAIDGSQLPKLPLPREESFKYLAERAEPPRAAHGESGGQLPLPPAVVGSNCWAVTADLTREGRALLACDMHLPLGVPNIWYRAQLHYRDSNGNPTRLNGATLPGVPALIIGSNERVAWGWTNAQINTTDLLSVAVEGDHYLIGDRREPLVERRERIAVRGRRDEWQVQRHTRWGPLLPQAQGNRYNVARWVGCDPRALDLGLMELEQTSSAETAIALGKRLRLPALNLFVADAEGAIGWSLVGSIPHRDYDASLPLPMYERGWREFVPPESLPSEVIAHQGRLWNANHRMVDPEVWPHLNTEDMVSGVRGTQIKRALEANAPFTPQAMLQLQLDDRAHFLDRWRDLLLSALDLPTAGEIPRREELRSAVKNWDGHCGANSIGYPCIREFRTRITKRILTRLLAPCYEVDPSFNPYCVDFEEPIWELIQERPPYLFAQNWNQLLCDILAETASHLTRTYPGVSLDHLTWDRCQNRQIRHPISNGRLPLKWWLDLPASGMGGDLWVPKLLSERLGASQRMSLAPGLESQGQFHMPGGQSGNPLTRNYRRGHRNWQYGEFQELLPGKTRHLLILRPKH